MATLHHLSYPYHISLVNDPSLLHALYKPFYHVSSHYPGHRGISAPRCDVTETETSYHLDCELSGVADKGAIHVTWLANNVLVIHGSIVIAGGGTSDIASASTTESNANDEHMPEHQMKLFPRLLVHERCIGPFQRSFSFADKIDKEAMTFSLQNGLLRINVPKAIFQDTTNRVFVQSSTG
ncbi:hypothetical protein VHEMI05875 [[Torrubiella] hemipterigena]|uniref:SHSP domain-containing protein n=1 Tax=[Torrubiella] hemipterigena TaxID=1531966 RepID=A0A0A1TJU0_9HYPO|nr:hypothetical protein VHEMI05875 [[Torrubiella] hemipterigena]